MKNLNLLQKNSMLYSVKKQKKIKSTIKTILLNLRMKVLIQALILITGDITVTADNNTDVASKNCASFSTCKRN